MHRAALAEEAAAELLQHAIGVGQRAEAALRGLGIVGGVRDVVRERHWTAFYFQQALGFQIEKREYFPYFQPV